MSRSQAFFRPVPVDSPVHRLAPETKVVAGIVISIGLVFNPLWSHVLVAAVLVVGVFMLAKLPRSVLPKIPIIVRFALFGGAIGAAASGEDPFVAGIGIGGLLDYARLITVGIVMILWAGILSWTTGLTAVGFAIRRLLRPLRRVGVPVDEIGSVVALAVRSLPLVADEIDDHHPPVVAYGRDLGVSVTGGVVVRDADTPPLFGNYVFGDFESGRLWALPIDSSAAVELPIALPGVVSFALDPDGGLWAASITTGEVGRLVVG